MTQHEKLRRLDSVISQLSPGRQGFAGDLVRKGFKTKRGLSDKQMFWVDRLTAIAVGEYSEPSAPESSVENAEGVYELFRAVNGTLKYPKIRLQTASGDPVALSRAGDRAKHPGTINVTDGGRYGENKWYGRIHPGGRWEHGRGGVPQDVQDMIERLSLTPLTVATEHGKLTGHCCFCNTELTDGRSTDMGYGPVCAKNWALPWGASAA